MAKGKVTVEPEAVEAMRESEILQDAEDGPIIAPANIKIDEELEKEPIDRDTAGNWRWKVTPDEAYTVYLALGANRTLEKLQKKLERLYGDEAPPLASLRWWNKKLDWAKRADLWHTRVARQAEDRLAARRVAVPDVVSVYRELNEALLRKATTYLANVEHTTITLKEVRELVDIARDIDKHLDAIYGIAAAAKDVTGKTIEGAKVADKGAVIARAHEILQGRGKPVAGVNGANTDPDRN